MYCNRSVAHVNDFRTVFVVLEIIVPTVIVADVVHALDAGTTQGAGVVQGLQLSTGFVFDALIEVGRLQVDDQLQVGGVLYNVIDYADESDDGIVRGLWLQPVA